MPIVYHESSQTFHLYNDEISYICTVLKNGQMGQLYFGARVHDKEAYPYLLETIMRGMSTCTFEDDPAFSLDSLKQEYPSYGTGDMRYPAFTVAQANGSRISDFVYQGHRITPGKPKLPGLPATYVEAPEEADTLEIDLYDELTDTLLTLRYSIFANLPAIARSVRFEQKGVTPVRIERAMSLSLDLPDRNYDMIELNGAWTRECGIEVRKLARGLQSVYSLRGNSGNYYNPFLGLKRPNATESEGEVMGFSLVYSGNFLAQAEVDTFDVTRVTIGINPENFSWVLREGESFQTPEAVVAYSRTGLNGLSHTFHRLYRERLARGPWRDAERPTLINNWEATYMDFNEEKILSLAEQARDLGIEMLVLDDGWFGARNDDFRGLGDWFVNTEKLPSGIGGLSRKIEDMGLRFGLWIEPEMVNKDSDLYRAHPDWALSTPGRRMTHGRNQYVLDYSRPEVVDGIYEQLEKVFADAALSYVKWDMNRNMTEVYSHTAAPEDQGAVMHRYILGVYSLYERLLERFPNILFESCASGGARFDPGMLYYAPQCWTSDDTDAVERLKIQYGTSVVYPLSSMGAHVSAVPNHQTNRITPLCTRGNVAYFGDLGYELDLTKLSPEELVEIKEQVAFYKAHRRLFQYGTFYRLLSPFDGTETAWMVVSSDRTEAMVGYYRVLQRTNDAFIRVRLQGLNPDTAYEVSRLGATIHGDELMNAGLVVSDASSGQNWEHYDGTNGDFQSRIYELRAV